MLTTNLLPANSRRALWFEEVRQIIIFFAAGTIIILLIASSLLLPSYLPLFLERKELERKFMLEEEALQRLKVQETIVKIRSVKAAIVSLKNFVNTSGRASAILTSLLGKAGQNITITIATVRSSSEVSFRGIARTRQDLLSFEAALRNSGRFQDIASPLSNIIQETNISFVIEGKLKPAFGL